MRFAPSWDLRRIRPHFFPRAASVVFGERLGSAFSQSEADTGDSGMPDDVVVWTGRLEADNASWPAAAHWLTRSAGRVRHTGQLTESPYSAAFTQGATFVPRVAFVVFERPSSNLGISRGRTSVQSLRSVQEKRPWKDLPDLIGVVESEFVHPFYSGDNVYPFCVGAPMQAVVPCDTTSVLDRARIETKPGLHQWWTQANLLWEENRSSDRMQLFEPLGLSADTFEAATNAAIAGRVQQLGNARL